MRFFTFIFLLFLFPTKNQENSVFGEEKCHRKLEGFCINGSQYMGMVEYLEKTKKKAGEVCRQLPLDHPQWPCGSFSLAKFYFNNNNKINKS